MLFSKKPCTCPPGPKADPELFEPDGPDWLDAGHQIARNDEKEEGDEEDYEGNDSQNEDEEDGFFPLSFNESWLENSFDL